MFTCRNPNAKIQVKHDPKKQTKKSKIQLFIHYTDSSSNIFPFSLDLVFPNLGTAAKFTTPPAFVQNSPKGQNYPQFHPMTSFPIPAFIHPADLGMAPRPPRMAQRIRSSGKLRMNSCQGCSRRRRVTWPGQVQLDLQNSPIGLKKACSWRETLNPIWVFNAAPPSCHRHPMELPETLFISVLGSTIFFLIFSFSSFSIFFF